MISIANLTKSYGERCLFKNVSLVINRGEKIGLVGPNGAGKSTLFSIILGLNEPTSGTVHIDKNIRIGYLAQEPNFTSTATVLSEAAAGDSRIIELQDEKSRLEREGKAGSSRYGEILHDLEFLGYFGLEHTAKKVLMGLGFKEADFDRPVGNLSGGWKMRVLLARLLTCPYDILFLDEPMNHLDLAAALWFKDYLLGFNATFVMISHDRDFLTEVTNYTLVLEGGTVTKVKGNYEQYDIMRSQQRVNALKKLKEQQKKRQQLSEFINRFHAQPNKASQVRAKRKALEMMPEIVVPLDRKESIRGFRFPPARRSGHRVVRLSGIAKAYGDISVYKNFDFEITQGERAVLVGENGAGKSTLLKILAGVIDIDSGTRELGHNVEIGYFSQTRLEVLNSQNTVFEEAYNASGGGLSGEQIRTILAAFFFVGDDIEKKVSILSGGEKSRLILAKLLIKPPNFLLLDEPTVHLDLDAVDALIQALGEYTGTLVFISHDIHFVRTVANTVYEVKAGQVKKFPGNFDYYWQAAKNRQTADARRGVSGAKGLSPKTKARGKLFLDREAQKKRKAHNARVAKQIKALRHEEDQLQLDRNVKARILSNPRSYHDREMVARYGRRLKEIEVRLAEIAREIERLKNTFI